MKTVKIISLLLIVTIFSGCINFFPEEDSGQADQGDTSNMSTYQTEDFSISLPSEWEVIDKNDLTNQVPPETIAVFRNNVKNETFTANVNILKRELLENVDSLEYANLANNREKNGLPGYHELSKEEITLSQGGSDKPTYIITFEGQKSTGEQLVRYIQTYAVTDNASYIVTGSFSPLEDSTTVQTVENIVRSFAAK